MFETSRLRFFVVHTTHPAIQTGRRFNGCFETGRCAAPPRNSRIAIVADSILGYRVYAAGMRIGLLANQAGVNVQTVRFYERRGLLPAPARRESGYRVYGPNDVHRLRFIRHAKTLGFSLSEIATILRMRERGKCPCGQVMRIGEKHVRDLKQQMDHMRRFHDELSRAVKSWKTLGEQRISADAICVLIERTMNQTAEKEKG